jgi:hypothetical protein
MSKRITVTFEIDADSEEQARAETQKIIDAAPATWTVSHTTVDDEQADEELASLFTGNDLVSAGTWDDED